MKFYISLLAIVFASNTIASGNVDFLEVDGDTVYFSTSGGKSHTLPSCVTPAKSDLWSVSLASDSGRAMYSLILTAMAKGSEMGLSIVSENHCGHVSDVEQAAKINLVAQQSPSNQSQTSGNSGKTIGMYKSDGVTRVGTVVGPVVLSNRSFHDAWHYIDSEPSKGFKTYYARLETWGSAYYTEQNCIGEVYFDYKMDVPKALKIMDGKYYQRVSEQELFTAMSQAYYSGNEKVCVDYNVQKNSYRYTPTIDELCGESLCVIKED
jgi:hypothetical protein